MSRFWKWIFIVVFTLVIVGNHAVLKLFAWGGGGSPLTISTFVTGIKYGSQIAVDNNGNVYVSAYEGCCTAGNKGVAKYNSAGVFQLKFGGVDAKGVAVDNDGNILVMDYQQDDVEKFDSNGNEIDISGTDFNNAAWNAPYSVTVDGNGNIYVANAFSNQVLKFNSALAAAGTITGNGGAFNTPQSVAVDSSNNLYVLDSGNNRVQKFDSSGTFVSQITGNGGAWNYPENMAVDDDGNVIVADSGNNRIQIFNSSGVFQQEITAATINASAPTVSYLSGLGLNNSGTIYVGDGVRVLKMTFDVGNPVVTITPLTSNMTTDRTPALSGTATDAISTISAVEYTVDSGSYSACVADDGAFDELSEEYTCNVSSELSIASHSISIRATDSKSNTNSGGSIASYTFSVIAEPVTNNEETTDIVLPPTSCTATAPTTAPDLYRIKRDGTNVTISFAPITGTYTGYHLSYGYLENQEVFSVIHNINHSSEGISYTVGSLNPNTQYFFRVRAMNDCVPGPWSNSLFVAGSIADSSSDTTPTPTNNTSITTPTTSPTKTIEVPIVTSSPTKTDTATEEATDGTKIVIVDINGNPVKGASISLTETEIPPKTQVNTSGPPEFITSVKVEPNSEVSSANILEQISNLVKYVFGTTTDPQGQIAINLPNGNYEVTVWIGSSSFTFPSVEIKNNQTVHLRLPVDLSALLAANPLPGMINRAEKISEAGVKVSGISLLIYTAFGIGTSAFVIAETYLLLYAEMGKGLASLPWNFLKGLGSWTKRFALDGVVFFAGDIFRQRVNDGLVFDASNHKPISGAYVVLYSPSGNLSTDFTDKAGRYYVKPEPDTYRIRANSLSYIFPSKIITIREDSVYTNIYVPGLEINVKEPERKVPRLSLPMDPKVSSSFSKWIRSFEKLLLSLVPLFYAFVFTVLFLASASANGWIYRMIFVALCVHLSLRCYSYVNRTLNGR